MLWYWGCGVLVSGSLGSGVERFRGCGVELVYSAKSRVLLAKRRRTSGAGTSKSVYRLARQVQ